MKMGLGLVLCVDSEQLTVRLHVHALLHLVNYLVLFALDPPARVCVCVCVDVA